MSLCKELCTINNTEPGAIDINLMNYFARQNSTVAMSPAARKSLISSMRTYTRRKNDIFYPLVPPARRILRETNGSLYYEFQQNGFKQIDYLEIGSPRYAKHPIPAFFITNIIPPITDFIELTPTQKADLRKIRYEYQREQYVQFLKWSLSKAQLQRDMTKVLMWYEKEPISNNNSSSNNNTTDD